MNKKNSNQHSMLSNVIFFVGMLFKVSPLLVIGEFIWGILLILPTRLVSVIGVKYFIDVVSGYLIAILPSLINSHKLSNPSVDL